MSIESEIRAIREGVALSEQPDRVAMVLSGPGAAECLNRVCPRELFIRDGQMLHTLLLNENGNPIADLYVCADGENFLLLSEGMPPDRLSQLLREHASDEFKIQIAVLTEGHAFISLNGPYAWELLSEVISPEVIGLPYLGFFRGDGFICFRAGMTGEFCYDLLVPREDATEWRERLLKTGRAFDLQVAGTEALDLCALENFFFNIRHDIDGYVTPMELQLQWRVSFKKTYLGSEALLARRQQWTHRAVLVVSAGPLKKGDRAFSESQNVGNLIHAGFSIYRNQWVGLALLRREFTYSGIELQFGMEEGAKVMATVISAPAINNRSLYVDPQRHSYVTRANHTFPPLVPERSQ